MLVSMTVAVPMIVFMPMIMVFTTPLDQYQYYRQHTMSMSPLRIHPLKDQRIINNLQQKLGIPLNCSIHMRDLLLPPNSIQQRALFFRQLQIILPPAQVCRQLERSSRVRRALLKVRRYVPNIVCSF